MYNDFFKILPRDVEHVYDRNNFSGAGRVRFEKITLGVMPDGTKLTREKLRTIFDAKNLSQNGIRTEIPIADTPREVEIVIFDPTVVLSEMHVGSHRDVYTHGQRLGLSLTTPDVGLDLVLRQSPQLEKYYALSIATEPFSLLGDSALALIDKEKELTAMTGTATRSGKRKSFTVVDYPVNRGAYVFERK